MLSHVFIWHMDGPLENVFILCAFLFNSFQMEILPCQSLIVTIAQCIFIL